MLVCKSLLYTCMHKDSLQFVLQIYTTVWEHEEAGSMVHMACSTIIWKAYKAVMQM